MIDQQASDLNAVTEAAVPPQDIVAERPIDDSNQVELPTVRPDGKPQRYDRNGVPILKKHELLELIKKQSSLTSQEAAPDKKKDDKKTKHKITFLDKVDKDAELVRTHYVLSYKRYNSMNTFEMDG